MLCAYVYCICNNTRMASIHKYTTFFIIVKYHEIYFIIIHSIVEYGCWCLELGTKFYSKIRIIIMGFGRYTLFAACVERVRLQYDLLCSAPMVEQISTNQITTYRNRIYCLWL